MITTTIPATADAFCRELINQLVAKTEQVRVVSSKGPELASLRATGVEVLGLNMRREPAPFADALALVRWIRLLHRQKPILVLALTPKASLLSLLAARIVGVPKRTYLLVGLRLEGETGLRRSILTMMERLTSACATNVVANSSSLADAYLALGIVPPHKLSHTHPGSDHGVDADYFAPRSIDGERVYLNPERVTIGFVGRITADKGIESLVKALDRASLRDRCQLRLVGSQNERDSQKMLHLLSQSGIQYEALGPMNDIRPQLAGMDVLVLPTRREGFPNVVLEASAMQVPVITTTAVGAIDSVIHGETGVLVPVDDDRALESALIRLVESPEERERMGAAGRRFVQQNFDPGNIVRQIVEKALEAPGPQA